MSELYGSYAPSLILECGFPRVAQRDLLSCELVLDLAFDK
jgi:hypothetical protein